MKNILKYIFIIIIVLVLMMTGAWINQLFQRSAEKEREMEYGSELIQQQLKNVSKLVVNEAKFSQILNYKDQQSYMMNLIKFEKKALVVVNADVQVMYDLRQLSYEIDEANKVVHITYIPKEEIKISPDIKIYDVEESRFNSFKGEDYNKINEKVKEDLKKKIINSNIQKNARNRLVTELSNILLVTQSLGWTLQYLDQPVENSEQMIEQLRLN